MIYLALDQALQTTGFAIFDNKTLIEQGSFTIPAGKPIEERLFTFFDKLDALKAVYNFEHLFFEDIQYQNNAETYKKLAFCQASILLWCYNNSMEYTILSPSHWRKTIKSKHGFEFGRSRAEQKKVAQQVVEKMFQIQVDSDIADAICIGCAGIQEVEQNRSAF